MRRAHLILLLSLTWPSPASSQTLFLELGNGAGSVPVRAELGGQTLTYTAAQDPQRLLKELEGIYSRSPHREMVSEDFLRQVGHSFFQPIAPLIHAASEIEVVIPENLIRIPLDLFYFENRPLFLHKPVTYSFSRQGRRAFSLSNDWSALIISDRSADPENGTYFLKKLLPESDYYNIRDLDLKRLQALPAVDVLLISGHGMIVPDGKDFIVLNREWMLSDHLSRLRPQLVYLDSCRLGISRDFIEGFRKAGTKYYVAPVLSNEAGNSSTKTIEFFFQALHEGDSPSQALFQARKRLYEVFRTSGDFGRLIWRAFPFRVYRLNGAAREVEVEELARGAMWNQSGWHGLSATPFAIAWRPRSPRPRGLAWHPASP